MDRREPLQEQIDSSPPARGRPKIAPRYRGLVSIHPLLRGADGGIILENYLYIDSSPPARGRLCMILVICKIHRFIPSCEGQTIPSRKSSRKMAIHPLLRGADNKRRTFYKAVCDSSPPARGRQAAKFPFLVDCRFIPSCEGQTLRPPKSRRFCMIHPLLRGADFYLLLQVFLILDSSPPARGRLTL